MGGGGGSRKANIWSELPEKREELGQFAVVRGGLLKKRKFDIPMHTMFSIYYFRKVFDEIRLCCEFLNGTVNRERWLTAVVFMRKEFS